MSECKIDILIERYDMSAPGPAHEDIGDYLLTRWRGEDDRPPDGYGTLATWFNKQLMKRVYEDNGRETMGVRIESEFDAVTGDDDVLRGEVDDDLAADGIDADKLRGAFISRSTMKRHLKGCLDGKKQTHSGNANWEQRSIELATDQAVRRITDALSSLASKGEFPDPARIDIDVSVQVSCKDDPYQIPLDEALRTGLDCAGTDQ